MPRFFVVLLTASGLALAGFARWMAVSSVQATPRVAATARPASPVSEPAASAPAEAAPLELAAPLDREGRLLDALPLYRAQAERTRTRADRLRYAAALMRAGVVDDARTEYEALASETGSIEHGTDAAADTAALCASSLLTAGFPAAALPYAERARARRSDHPTIALLVVRAMAAAGDADGARVALAALRESPAWVVGQRLELARWRLLAGDVRAARAILDDDIAESVGQMFRDSILATLPLRDGDWQQAAGMLAVAARKVPSPLSSRRVDRSWRNAQRELWSVQLRHAIALWKLGRQDAAARAVRSAAESDEEYVGTGARLLSVAAELARGHEAEALDALRVLAGHDPRFGPGIARLERAITDRTDAAAAVSELHATLAGLDRSAEVTTRPLFEILAAAAQASPHAAETPRPAARPVPPGSRAG